MTSLQLQTEELPPLNSFFYSVAPGVRSLKDNIHFLHDFNDPNLPKSFIWPLSSNSNNLAKLDTTYLNISRPPLNPGPGINESNTYVSLPFHITNIFRQIIDNRIANNTIDGGMQIGANVSSMMPDPFRLVHLNPGCLTEVLVLNNGSRSLNPFDDSNAIKKSDTKNPFTKLTNNFNKLLKLSSPNPEAFESSSLFDTYDDLISAFSDKNNRVLGKLLSFEDSYYKEITSVNTAKIIVSANVNVINVLGLDSSSDFMHTETKVSPKPYTSLLEEEETSDNAANNTNTSNKEPSPTSRPEGDKKSYTHTTETPLLRFTLKPNHLVTCMKVFNISNVPMLILGLNTGEIVMINLRLLTYKVLLSIDNKTLKSDIKMSSNLTNDPITSLEIIHHHLYQCLIIAGTANGEVVFIDPFAQKDSHDYIQSIVDTDRFVTYFKKFDLSPFNRYKGEDEIVGHIKVSYKPITSITSTLSISGYHSSASNGQNPMLIAIGSDDGLVRILPLTSTYNLDYGSNSNRKSFFSDVLSNYFHCGIRGLRFSNDFKFLAVTGNGDLIELFRISYYNVNSLLHKNVGSTNPSGRRSRSGTVNSTSSNTQQPTGFSFLSPTITSPSTSFDVSSNTGEDPHLCPPAIKDINVACRLKSHTNTIVKVDFIHDDHYLNPELESKDNHSLYRLVSFGNDGKIIFWEFDYKALPRIKKVVRRSIKSHNESHVHLNQLNQQTLGSSKRPGAPSKMKRNTDNSLNLGLPGLSSPLSGSLNNMASILAGNDSSLHLHESTSQLNMDEFINDQIKGIAGMYISLQDIRLKKYYRDSIGYGCVIHPIRNDKHVPSIDIPSSSIDVTYWFTDGKMSNIYLDGRVFWCFGRNGDIIKYVISES